MRSDVLSQVQRMYGDNCFLDAYALGNGTWRDRKWLETAGPKERIWASRLAGRVGGVKLRRVLARQAMELYPEHPLVRLDSRWQVTRRRPLFSLLQQSIERPRLESGHDDLDAEWLIDGAWFWSTVRDFERAHSMLDEAAVEHGADGAWFHCVRSHLAALPRPMVRGY